MSSRQNKERDLHKVKARYLIEQAVKIGFIVRPEECFECGIKCKPDGHHEDYSKPLEVIWLCRPCHKERHRKNDSTQQRKRLSTRHYPDS